SLDGPRCQSLSPSLTEKRSISRLESNCRSSQHLSNPGAKGGRDLHRLGPPQLKSKHPHHPRCTAKRCHWATNGATVPVRVRKQVFGSPYRQSCRRTTHVLSRMRLFVRSATMPHRAPAPHLSAGGLPRAPAESREAFPRPRQQRSEATAQN